VQPKDPGKVVTDHIGNLLGSLMPPKSPLASYRLHKSTAFRFVRLDGRDLYSGSHSCCGRKKGTGTRPASGIRGADCSSKAASQSPFSSPCERFEREPLYLGEHGTLASQEAYPQIIPPADPRGGLSSHDSSIEAIKEK
jgi:hypothetical protein